MGKACFFLIYYYAVALRSLHGGVERPIVLKPSSAARRGRGTIVSSTSYEDILIELPPEIVTWR